MDDLMTSRELQQLLHVDRITIYRMLEDGRLPGFKVGGQWRFPRREVENWLQGQRASAQPPAPLAMATLEPALTLVTPASAGQSPLPACMQAVQDILAEACETVAVTVSTQGVPLTQVSRPCDFCSKIMSTEEGRRRCESSWQTLATQHAPVEPVRCHAGLSYLVHQVSVDGEPAAAVMIGQRPPQWAVPDHERVESLGQACGLPPETLGQALAELPVQSDESVRRATRLLRLTAKTFAEMGQERMQLLGRLQRIAEMTVLD
jgi:excisionase family DNA binding protein